MTRTTVTLSLVFFAACAPQHIVDRMVEALKDPVNHRYPETEGLPEFRKAVAGWYERRFGLTFDPEKEVTTLIGSKEGMSPGETE